MDILAINGSPRKTGITNLMLERFLEGVRDTGAEAELIQLSDEQVHHCTGEFHCWIQNPGVCLWDEKKGDTMAEIRRKFAESDKVILGTPVYVDGMTGLMKNMFDRMIPIVYPFIELDAFGDIRHPLRFGEVGKKVVLLSCSGFPEIETFSALVKHFERIMMNLRADLVGKLLRPTGGALANPEQLDEETRNRIFSALSRAGREFALSGRISPEDERDISLDYIPDKNVMVQMFNATFESLIKSAAA